LGRGGGRGKKRRGGNTSVAENSVYSPLQGKKRRGRRKRRGKRQYIHSTISLSMGGEGGRGEE